MRNNISDLESRNNWLEKEKRREEKISAWDMDEGKRIREEHAENCDVKDAEAFHESRHQKRSKINIKATGENEESPNTPGSWFFIDLILLFVLVGIRIIAPYNLPFHFLSVIVLFLGINPGIFIWLFAAKKFPPKVYWKFLFFLTLLVELAAAVLYHPHLNY